MKFYDPDTREIFEATEAEYKAAMDIYHSKCMQDRMISGGAPHIITLVRPVLKGHLYWIHKSNEEYTMNKFEDKFVYFRWTEELRGKKCFVADDIAELYSEFKNGTRRTITGEFNECYPFGARGGFRFAYYDPNYDCKVAFNEGKKIQSRQKGNSWCDDEHPEWLPDFEYRIKPVGLQWTDLKIGDVIHKSDMTRMVVGIDSCNTTAHICVGSTWLTDEDLEDWVKV